MLSNTGKLVTIYIVTGIIGKNFSKAFAKHNIEKGFHVTGNYPLNRIFGEDEFLSACVTDRPYSQLSEPASAPSSCQDSNGERTSVVFMKVSPEIIRLFPQARPRKTGGSKHRKSRIQTDTPEKNDTENQRAVKGKRKYSERTLEKKTVKKRVITVGSSNREP